MKIYQVCLHANMDRLYYFYVRQPTGEATILDERGRTCPGFIIPVEGFVYYDKLVYTV